MACNLDIDIDMKGHGMHALQQCRFLEGFPPDIYIGIVHAAAPDQKTDWAALCPSDYVQINRWLIGRKTVEFLSNKMKTCVHDKRGLGARMACA